MSFDTIEYVQALDEFLMKMEQVSELPHPVVSEALEGICRLLRIARVELAFDEISAQRISQKREVVLYAKGEADEARVFCQQEGTNEAIEVYKIYPCVGDIDWNVTEREEIRVLIKMIFVFHRRFCTIQVAENLMYKDQELDVYNYTYFLKAVDTVIEQGCIGRYAACCFNLKSFSIINQRVGRRQGTEIMRSYARQLQDKLSSEEVVCRIGGDTFVVLFFKENLEVIQEYLTESGIIYNPESGDSVLISATAGYYMIPDSCETSSEVMDCIRAAINMAKNIMKIPYVFFDEKLKKNQTDSKFIEKIFPEAIEREEFQVYYQPKVLLSNYKLAGAEALCRWFHNGEMFPPFRFIPVLEQSKAICTLDFYMLDHVCRDIRRWLDEGREVVKVSVNLSRRHLGGTDLLEHLLAIIDKHNVPHEYIEIELTETTMDVNFTDLKNIVFGLQEQGISTSVDDFGVGYSSLNLIRELPWNVLKIDKSFLPEREDGKSQKYVMLKYLIAMAQDMGLECIAEGVETVEQIKMLKENNCYLAQGFYFDKPLPVEVFEKLLDK